MTSRDQLPAMAMFAELVQSSRNLPNTASDIGHINLSLAEIQRRVAHVRRKYPDDNATKAHYLLAGSGINGEDVANELQSIIFTPEKSASGRIRGSVGLNGSASSKLGTHPPKMMMMVPSTSTASQHASTMDADVNSYLRTKKEESILATIEDTAAAKARDFDLFLAQNVTLDWKARRNDICRYFGVSVGSSSQDTDSSTTTNNENSSVLRTSHRPLKRKWGRATPGQMVLYAEFTDVQPEESAGAYQAKAQKFAKVVQNLNVSRANQIHVPIAHEFMSAAFESAANNDLKTRQMLDNWKILAAVTNEGPEAPVAERKFASEYIFHSSSATSGVAAAESSKLNRQIIEGARKYLQDQFYRLAEDEVARHPHEAQMGGVPSVYSKIRGYLNLKFGQDCSSAHPNLEVVNNVPIWALLYYMIRSGHYEEALQYTTDNEASFLTIERSFPSYLRAYVTSPSRDLPRDMLERLHTEFHQHIQYVGSAPSDPYKYVLYKLIGRCDLSRKAFPEVVTTTEDWLWLHLMLTRETPATSTVQPQQQSRPNIQSRASSSSLNSSRSPRSPFGKSAKNAELNSTNAMMANLLHEQYGLQDLQRTVLQFGPKHFNGQNNANQAIYFQVLLLCGLFEHAIHYAYSFSVIDSVHFAVALTYYGLLRPVPDVADSTNCELLVLDRRGADKAQINYAALIGQYTSSFKYSDYDEAVDYLLTLGLNRDIPSCGERQIDLCREALTELVLDTRAFAKLLGTVMVNGNRKPGIIETRMPLLFVANESEYLNVITTKAAQSASENGRTQDALLLYHLSEKYDSVIKLVNRMLGEVLSITEPGQRSSRRDFGNVDGSSNSTFSINPAAVSLADVDDPTYIARSMMTLYTTNPAILSNVAQKNRQTCEILLKLVDAWDHFAKKQWDQTIRAVQDTNILILDSDANITFIRDRAQEFSTLDESIARNIPTLLLMVMQALVQWSQTMNDSAYVNSGRTTMLAALRDMARSALLYAGMIQYRMPREVYNQLTSLEVAI